MDEQGMPQVTNAQLIADLEAILLELRNRLDNYLDLGANDLIAADEGFNFAGQLQATLADAVEHTASIREPPGRDPARRLLSKWRFGRRDERLGRFPSSRGRVRFAAEPVSGGCAWEGSQRPYSSRKGLARWPMSISSLNR
jgi:hypothetical protein